MKMFGSKAEEKKASPPTQPTKIDITPKPVELPKATPTQPKLVPMTGPAQTKNYDPPPLFMGMSLKVPPKATIVKNEVPAIKNEPPKQDNDYSPPDTNSLANTTQNSDYAPPPISLVPNTEKPKVTTGFSFIKNDPNILPTPPTPVTSNVF